MALICPDQSQWLNNAIFKERDYSTNYSFSSDSNPPRQTQPKCLIEDIFAKLCFLG